MHFEDMEKTTYEEKFLDPERSVLTVFYFFKSELNILLIWYFSVQTNQLIIGRNSLLINQLDLG